MASCVASGPGSTWQKFKTRTNSSSEIHFRLSTICRCIRPIWPTGPPKASQPSLRKYQKISCMETFCAASSEGPLSADFLEFIPFEVIFGRFLLMPESRGFQYLVLQLSLVKVLYLEGYLSGSTTTAVP